MPPERLSRKGWPSHPTTTVLWEALTQDSAAKVAVIDRDGTVVVANRAYSQWFSKGGPLAGRRLDSFLNDEFAQEREGLIERVLKSGKPVRLRSTWRGVRQDEFIRPLPERIGGRAAVLVTISSCELGVDATGPGAAKVVQAEHVDEGHLASISPRERVVLSLIGAGMPTAEIAKTLGRSTKTIENQRLSLGRKLGARNRVELARIAIESGLAAKVANTKLSMR